MGGIARTVRHRGNRIDIGGHRFFSKSDRVMEWWLDVLPLERRALAETGEVEEIELTYHSRSSTIEAAGGPDPAETDAVMLVRPRRSRIYYRRKFFPYPINLSPTTLRNLGVWRSLRIGMSYLWSLLLPIRRPANLEEFFINRFGRELYLTFFKDYTEKVWGVSCREISAEWGAQRVKGLSISRALLHFARSLFRRQDDLAQKGSETSLIERFLYPKYGPGQLWEEVARRVRAGGGEIREHHRVDAVRVEGRRVTAVEGVDERTGDRFSVAADAVISTMPIRDLTRALDCQVPPRVREIAEGLVYRDFVTVGLLLSKLEIREEDGSAIRDTWIYIQEPEVKVGRLQIFNNWSPYMVADPSLMWVGLEYFCNEGDDLWSCTDEELRSLAVAELETIDIARRENVLDSVVIRMPKTYPAYFGTYERFDELRAYLDSFENLALVGRNGMHKYNNQDHSMLTAMLAVENLAMGRTDKSNLWAVNTEEEYHEEK